MHYTLYWNAYLSYLHNIVARSRLYLYFIACIYDDYTRMYVSKYIYTIWETWIKVWWLRVESWEYIDGCLVRDEIIAAYVVYVVYIEYIVCVVYVEYIVW